MLSRRQFTVIAAVLSAARMTGARGEERGFVPLAGVSVAIDTPSERDQVLAALRQFGVLEHLSRNEGTLLKFGREVVLMKLARDRQTFFYGDNFSDPKRLLLIVYSHDSKDVWRPIWRRLIDQLTATVGRPRVIDEFEY